MTAKQQGFTLTELLVAMAVGFAVLAAITNVLISSNGTNLSTLRLIRLDQELRGAMSLITRDMRRAGFNASASTFVGSLSSPTFLASADFQIGAKTGVNDCGLYAYDENLNGAADGNGERFGFARRVNAGGIGIIESRQSGSDCTGDWSATPLTAPDTVDVTALTFTPRFRVICINDRAGMRVKQVTIRIQGRSPQDATLTRTLEETVRVRNDEMLTYSGTAPDVCVNT